MKKILNYLLLFSLFFCLQGVAQKSQNEQPLSNKTTIKGKRELRKEMRIHNATVKLSKQNEREARKKHKLGTANHHDSKAKKLGKDRKKAQKKEERENEKAAKSESKKQQREEKDREDKVVKNQPSETEKG